MENGHDSKLFENYKVVFSGHYHTRSSDGHDLLCKSLRDVLERCRRHKRIPRLRHETLEHTPVNNPYQLFHNIYYEDTDHQLFDAGYFHDKIVKVIVKKKTDITKFEKFIDKLYTAGVHDLKIVENFQLIEG